MPHHPGSIPQRHTAAASAARAIAKTAAWPSSAGWGPAQSPRIQPGVNADFLGICILVTMISIRFLVVLAALSPLVLFSLPTRGQISIGCAGEVDRVTL